MKTLTAEFLYQADQEQGSAMAGRQTIRDQDDVNGTAAAGEQDSLTFEYADNPFASLLREVEQLCDRAPEKAYRLLKLAVAEGLYIEPDQQSKLCEKLDEVYEKVRQDKEKIFAAEAGSVPPLGSAFSAGVAGLDRTLPATPPLRHLGPQHVYGTAAGFANG